MGERGGSVPEQFLTTPGGSFICRRREARSCPFLTGRPFISSIVRDKKKQPIRAGLVCLLCVRDGGKIKLTEQSGGFMRRNTSKYTQTPELPQISISFEAFPLKITRTDSPQISDFHVFKDSVFKKTALIKHDHRCFMDSRASITVMSTIQKKGFQEIITDDNSKGRYSQQREMVFETLPCCKGHSPRRPLIRRHIRRPHFKRRARQNESSC